MTSIAKVKAHCGSSKEVVIQLWKPVPNDESTLQRETVKQDGEEFELVFHDDLQVVVFERLKE